VQIVMDVEYLTGDLNTKLYTSKLVTYSSFSVKNQFHVLRQMNHQRV